MQATVDSPLGKITLTEQDGALTHPCCVSWHLFPLQMQRMSGRSGIWRACSRGMTRRDVPQALPWRMRYPAR